MDAAAIVMMLVALITVWGGLVAAIVHLSKHPDQG
ncbi:MULTISPECIES: methionine/alanine import family NSS transporter small subunit [Actinomycetes]|nr:MULTISPECIES: methionine/alanine import family NSS transporter small subunit [unclassified Nesterenkonia]MDS2174173.1 methionine/alanine import family NSS transporter small subunit [Nesterenkonia sp. CL21]